MVLGEKLKGNRHFQLMLFIIVLFIWLLIEEHYLHDVLMGFSIS